MEIKQLDIEGLVLFTPNIFKDNRGYFLETYRLSYLNEAGITNLLHLRVLSGACISRCHHIHRLN